MVLKSKMKKMGKWFRIIVINLYQYNNLNKRFHKIQFLSNKLQKNSKYKYFQSKLLKILKKFKKKMSRAKTH